MKRCFGAVVLTTLLLPLVAVAQIEAPLAVSPGAADHRAAVESACPTFSWSLVEAARGYEIAVWKLDDTSFAVSDLPVQQQRFPKGVTSWTPALGKCLDRGASYAWAVRAIGKKQGGEWSEARLLHVAAGPTRAEFEQALRVVREGLRVMDFAPEAPRDGTAPALTQRNSQTGAAPAPELAVSLLTKSAIRGELTETAEATVGIVGISNSPDGAGVLAANADPSGGADLVLNGSAQGLGDTALTESGISAGGATFDIGNDTDSLTLTVDGQSVVTVLTDQDTLGALSCAAGQRAEWNGTLWICSDITDTLADLACVGGEIAKFNGAIWECAIDETSTGGGDADTLDGLDSTDFALAVHAHDDRYFTETELATEGLGAQVHWNNLTNRPAGLDDGAQRVAQIAFASGPSATPSMATQFLAPTAQVTVETGQTVVVNSNRAFGTQAAGGAAGLDLFICYRVAGSGATPTMVGAGAQDNLFGKVTRIIMGLSAAIGGLDPGSYEVGLCGDDDGDGRWDNNSDGYTTAMVID
jgi:hypothetical protein